MARKVTVRQQTKDLLWGDVGSTVEVENTSEATFRLSVLRDPKDEDDLGLVLFQMTMPPEGKVKLDTELLLQATALIAFEVRDKAAPSEPPPPSKPGGVMVEEFPDPMGAGKRPVFANGLHLSFS